VRDTDVVKVDLDVAYVAISIQNVSSTSEICCKCFYLDVAYVVVAIHIRCKSMFQLFHLLHTYVTKSAFMLQVFREQVYAQMVPCVHVFHFHIRHIVGCCNIS
jgi:hypothetical protein